VRLAGRTGFLWGVFVKGDGSGFGKADFSLRNDKQDWQGQQQRQKRGQQRSQKQILRLRRRMTTKKPT
jgi:hypothetical protein